MPDPWTEEHINPHKTTIDDAWKSLYLQRPESTQIQCSMRAARAGGMRCANEAWALVFSIEQMESTDRVPAYCKPCCFVVIDQMRPEQQLMFQRLKR